MSSGTRFLRTWHVAGWLLAPALASYGQAAPGPAPAAGTAHRICWQEGHRLTWADFRAPVFPKSAPFAAARMGAVSATWSTVTAVTVAGVLTYRVDSVFLRDSSWVNKQAIRTAADRAETLAHEQLHFDIAELTARKLRQRIALGLQAGENLYTTQASQDIQRLQAEEDNLSNQFDQEVRRAGGHKTEAPVRKRWQARIAQELRVLAAYKSTAATCP